MALTRKFLSALGVEADKIDEIINAHTETVDGLKDELAKVKADADKLPEVAKERDELKAAAEKAGKDTYKVKYDALKEDYEAYKKSIEDAKTKESKSAAYRELLKAAGISEKRIDAVLKVSDVDSVELDADGKIKDSDKLTESIKSEWSDFIEQGNKSNVRVDLGGSLQNNGKAMTIEEIDAIEDDAERQAAMLENHTLYGF